MMRKQRRPAAQISDTHDPAGQHEQREQSENDCSTESTDTIKENNTPTVAESENSNEPREAAARSVDSILAPGRTVRKQSVSKRLQASSQGRSGGLTPKSKDSDAGSAEGGVSGGYEVCEIARPNKSDALVGATRIASGTVDRKLESAENAPTPRVNRRSVSKSDANGVPNSPHAAPVTEGFGESVSTASVQKNQSPRQARRLAEWIAAIGGRPVVGSSERPRLGADRLPRPGSSNIVRCRAEDDRGFERGVDFSSSPMVSSRRSTPRSEQESSSGYVH